MAVFSKPIVVVPEKEAKRILSAPVEKKRWNKFAPAQINFKKTT